MLFFQIIKRLVAIIAIPATTPPIAMWCFPYFSAVGKSSSKDIYIMIPATADKIRGNAMLVPVSSMPNAWVIMMHSTAPNNSLNPDRVAYSSALPLLCVA